MPSRSSRILATLWKTHNCLVRAQRGIHIPRPYVADGLSYTFGTSPYPLEYKTLGTAFKETVQRTPDSVALCLDHQNRIVTFREYFEDVNRMSNALLDLNLKKGDVVGIWLMNCYEWFLVQQASLRTGIIFCCLSPFYKHIELDYALKKANIKALFLPSKASPQSAFNDFTGILEKTDVKTIKETLRHLIFVEDDGNSSSLKNHFHLHSFNNLLSSSSGTFDEAVADSVTAEDPASIKFTSGTTGKPKATQMSHFHLYNDIVVSDRRLRNYPGAPKRATIAIPLPLFHAYAGVGSLAIPIIGHKGVFSDYWFRPEPAAKGIAKHECTEFWGVPALLIAISECAQRLPSKIIGPTVACSGGAMLNSTILGKIREGFPTVERLINGYGATECGPVLTLTLEGDTEEQRTNTVGRVVDHVEVKLVDPVTKEIVKLGQEGELWARGFCRMICYLNDEEKTKEVIDPSGWYNLGDIALMDEEGFLKISGRTKEMIIRGGINIFPKEIESLLHTCPGVVDAHVCGIPDPVMGEEICAWIKMRDSNFDEEQKADEIKGFCKEVISSYKVPKHILFVDSFPMTASGKAQKFQMTKISCKKLKIPVEEK